jgi:hypothetical protein
MGCICIKLSCRLRVSPTGKGKPDSKNKPTNPAVQISDADCRRKILITDKCTTTFQEWQDKGESFRVDRDRCIMIAGRCYHQIMPNKTKTAPKQETYTLSDPKHDLQCGFVELGA